MKMHAFLFASLSAMVCVGCEGNAMLGGGGLPAQTNLPPAASLGEAAAKTASFPMRTFLGVGIPVVLSVAAAVYGGLNRKHIPVVQKGNLLTFQKSKNPFQWVKMAAAQLGHVWAARSDLNAFEANNPGVLDNADEGFEATVALAKLYVLQPTLYQEIATEDREQQGNFALLHAKYPVLAASLMQNNNLDQKRRLEYVKILVSWQNKDGYRDILRSHQNNELTLYQLLSIVALCYQHPDLFKRIFGTEEMPVDELIAAAKYRNNNLEQWFNDKSRRALLKELESDGLPDSDSEEFVL